MQRPGSTLNYAGQAGAPVPPPYGGVNQGYNSVPPSAASQWPAPVQNPASGQQQWSQESQQGNWGQQGHQPVAGYNPVTYGATPGAYGQAQQQDVPPPPPPKPQGFAAAVQAQAQPQQASQNWQQGGFQQQQGGYPGQGAEQQSYNTAAPPPPSQTPGGSYFPPSQTQPGSLYGADQVGTYTTTSSAMAQQPPSTIMTPNEQQPAYIPPSLSGQGVTAYMPANTNPMPGVYVPPPPDIPAWQQAAHAPLQGADKKFRYTKPTVDPSFHGQGYQAAQPQTQQPMYHQLPQPVQHNQQAYGQPSVNQQQHQGQLQNGQFVHPNQPVQQQFSHPTPQQDQSQQQQPQLQPQTASNVQPYNQVNQTQYVQQPAHQYQQSSAQWQQTKPAEQSYAQQQEAVPASYGGQQYAQQLQWQNGTQHQGQVMSQQHAPEPDVIQAPKPLGRSGTIPPDFVNQPMPESQPVSPLHNRQSVSFPSAHNTGRTSSISSIALDAIRNQQAQSASKLVSPALPVQQSMASPPKPAGADSAFSALGYGGPSDWEHFGNPEQEVDDEELFGAKKEDKTEPAQTGSVELPGSNPSPAWQPTPPNQAAHPASFSADLQGRDTYQPTPPPKAATPAQRPPSQPPQHVFGTGDAINQSQSPQPGQLSQPPATQQSFAVDDGAWVPPPQGTLPQHQPQQAQTAAQQDFALVDGGVLVQAQSTQPTAAQHNQPHTTANNAFPVADAAWAPAEQDLAQAQGVPHKQHVAELKAKDEYRITLLKAKDEHYAAELKAKDDAYGRLEFEFEKERIALRTEVDRLKAVIETQKAQLQAEKSVLHEQVEAMKAATEQAKSNADALVKEKDSIIEAMRTATDKARTEAESSVKEKDSIIERLKEEAEGKDDIIKERDAIIADLKRQLDVEKSKEPPKPTPADLVPDIDPWYAGSLERYISMLRSEAMEPQVENKINVFTGFLRAESAVRGLEYYSSLPAPIAPEPIDSLPQQIPLLSRPASIASNRKPDMHVSISPQDLSQNDPVQYSPGGRPIIQHKSTFGTGDGLSSQQPVHAPSGQVPPRPTSIQSTSILTPSSSVDEDMHKTPIQSPPEEQAQPQYKAYVPPAPAPTVTESNHRVSMSFVTSPSVAPLHVKKTGKHDEVFFGGPQPTSSNPASQPPTSDSALPDDAAAMPAPLSVKPNSPTIVASAPTQSPPQTLVDLLPKQIHPASPHPRLQRIRLDIQTLPSESASISELTTKWEKAASLMRKRNEEARRKRQEDSEARTNQLFDDHEISYPDIGVIEDEFKEKERLLKAQEDRDEYRTYVEEVFDKVYDSLQLDIKAIMDLYFETEGLLHTSVSGVRVMEGDVDAPTMKEALEVVKELHTAAEVRHEKVVQAVAERDKRYKKTEIQPLYAAGDIQKMKAVEKHFDKAEKQAAARAKAEKVGRLEDLVALVEDVVVRAVATEQGDVDRIVAAIKDLSDDAGQFEEVEERREILGRARETLLLIKDSSKELLTFLNVQEHDLNMAFREADVAHAQADGADAARIIEIEQQAEEKERLLKGEFERKLGILEKDWDGVDELLKEKWPRVSEEDEKKRRMKAALEEARRRNGDV